NVTGVQTCALPICSNLSGGRKMFSMTKGITTWKNWSESVHCSDIEYVEPNSLEVLRHVVKECYEKGRNIRVVGSGHSFTPLVATNDVFISINRLQGISSIHSDG